jgi:Undecaprenyl-phosphate glucose phosphotransferase
LLDAVAILLAGAGAFGIYLGLLKGGVSDYPRHYLAVVLAAVIFPFVHRRAGGYTIPRLRQLSWQVGRVSVVWAGTMSTLSTLAFVAKVAETYSRSWATLFALFSFAAVGTVRIGVAAALDHWAEKGRLSKVVAVVGAGELGQQVIAKLRAAKGAPVAIAGVFDDRLTRVPMVVDGYPVLGTTDDLIALVRRSLIDEVVLALPLRAEARIGELVAKLRSLPVDLRLSLDPIGGGFPIQGINEVASIQMLEIIDRPLKNWSAVVKWFEDKILGIACLVMFAPIMAIIALAIRLDSKGPSIFTQERFGFNNNTIRVFKFRTMRVEESDPTGAARTIPGDQRVTRVGRILRRLSLDELPQLFNVLLGEMSLVGPRPHVVAMKAGGRLYHEAVGEYFLRHRVRPGMTGWAQVNGLRGEIDSPENARARVEHDLWYIDNWSLWLDCKILFMTAHVILTGKNAY